MKNADVVADAFHLKKRESKQSEKKQLHEGKQSDVVIPSFPLADLSSRKQGWKGKVGRNGYTLELVASPSDGCMDWWNGL